MDEHSVFSLPLAASPWPIQFGVIVLLAAVGAWLAWWLATLQTRISGLDIREDIWEAIKDSPMAVAVYRVGIVWALFALVAHLMGRFA